MYDIKDMIQAAIGAFSAVFLFFLIRGGDPLNIDPKFGLVTGIIWLTLLYQPWVKNAKEHKKHFIGNLVISIAICSILSVGFNLVTTGQLLVFGFFGTTAWLTVLMAMPVAQLFDLHNITNILDRYYATKKHKRR